MELENEKIESKNFIELIIDKDLEEGRFDHVQTRFPPEPNGYLHIGHAKSILLNYGLAKKYNGKFNMRFDDTNPTKEKEEFVESILKDIKWLGADWEDRLFFASNYFEQMYEAAIKLIKKGKAYVCDLSPEEIREYRGTLTEPGKDSPYRNRSVDCIKSLPLICRLGIARVGIRTLLLVLFTCVMQHTAVLLGNSSTLNKRGENPPRFRRTTPAALSLANPLPSAQTLFSFSAVMAFHEALTNKFS